MESKYEVLDDMILSESDIVNATSKPKVSKSDRFANKLMDVTIRVGSTLTVMFFGIFFIMLVYKAIDGLIGLFS